MKTRLLITILLFGAAFSAWSQTHTPRYISMGERTKAYYEYLPEGYDATAATTYPLILFMTGIGEFGSGSPSQLPLVLKWGIPKEIENGRFPKSVAVGSEVFRFIVITPQFIKFPRPTAEDVEDVLNYVVAHYKVDLNRIYISGLSYGGGLCWAYPGANAANAKRIAAIVPVASPVPEGGDSIIYERSRVIAANDVAVWATHNLRDQDDTVATTISYVNYINQPPAPEPPAKMTLFNAGGHNAWDRTYNPDFRENGLNVYEWMLQYKRNSVVANVPPKATAGSDQTITLPANSVTLTGSGTDSDGSIASYAWTKVSGSAGGTFTVSNAATAQVTGLVQGTYVFRLTVTDDKGATASDEVTVTVNAAPNQLPKANAGTDISIVLPTNTATLSGSGTDEDGTIAAYAWTKVSGPAGGAITAPAAATTSVSGLQQGNYVFRLTVTDDKGGAASDEVSVVVNAAPNQSPKANAGADITITLPTNAAMLSGSGTDADGSIASYLWTKVSGPAGGVISASNATTTQVTGLVQGVYIFRLTVTDDKGATASDDVSLSVNASPNQLPLASAGSDQTITLPTNSVTLSGSGSDADGSISSYAWSKISGPVSETITNVGAASTTVTGLIEGSYTFRLTVIDNDGATASDDVTITVLPEPNKPPKAVAGPDQSITLPVNEVQLSGSGTDSDGTISRYSWTKVSGPGAGSITNAAAAATTVTGLTQGTYTFRLAVIDNDGDTGTDDLTITVLPTVVTNQPPQVSAGADQTITLPDNDVTLTGTATDADGSIVQFTWTKTSGPASGAIATATAATTAVSGLVQGVYNFRLTVKDNEGATAFDEVQVTVHAAANKTPVAHAGADVTLTLPTNTTTLSGSGTDEDGTIAAYAWTKVSGPAGGAITAPAAATTNITGLQQGNYVFRLTVTDDKGGAASDDVGIIVNAEPNLSPKADAGSDITITLPINTVTLSGNGTDADGSIASYLWTKVSGPTVGTITDAAVPQTALNNLVQGSYTFRLTVTDDKGASDSDDVSVTVLAAPVNQPPVANAGLDQSITLPVDSIKLRGTGTDNDGRIAAFLWTKVSGPAGGNLATPDADTSLASSLQQGTYVFRLTVTDDKGATASDDLTVAVRVDTTVDPEPTGANFSIMIAPNPTENYFSLKLLSSSARPAYLRVSDAVGRVMEERTNVARNTVLRLGQQYKPGVYYAEVVQDGKKKTVRLLKL